MGVARKDISGVSFLRSAYGYLWIQEGTEPHSFDAPGTAFDSSPPVSMRMEEGVAEVHHIRCTSGSYPKGPGMPRPHSKAGVSASGHHRRP
jgi:hypothetical protein